MSQGDYPRDLIGYGRTPPHPRWPGDAHIAVQFVLNYEEGGENCILHGDAASEAFLSEIVGAQAWPGQRHMNMELIYEFGSRAGFWRLWRLFTERNLPLTVYAVAMAMARNPDAVAAMNEAGWEIASHGLKWIDYKDFAREDERHHIARGDPHPHRGGRQSPARHVPGTHLGQHPRSRHGGAGLPLRGRFLCRRAALLGRAARTARS